MFMPQGLCMCCSLCMKCLPTDLSTWLAPLTSSGSSCLPTYLNSPPSPLLPCYILLESTHHNQTFYCSLISCLSSLECQQQWGVCFVPWNPSLRCSAKIDWMNGCVCDCRSWENGKHKLESKVGFVGCCGALLPSLFLSSVVIPPSLLLQ